MVKASIITVVYNGAATITDTIQSVLRQDYENIEYIVIDGNSTDRTVDIVRSYGSAISRFVSEEDRGIYHAMNKGIRLATGEIVAVLNSDDVYVSSSVVRDMVETMEAEGTDAAYGDKVYVRPSNVHRIVRYWKPGPYRKGAFNFGWMPPHQTFFCRTSLFEKYGYYNLDYTLGADFELLLRFIEKYRIRISYIPKIMVCMRTGGQAGVIGGILKSNRETMNVFRDNGLPSPPPLMLCARKLIYKLSQTLKRPPKGALPGGPFAFARRDCSCNSDRQLAPTDDATASPPAPRDACQQ